MSSRTPEDCVALAVDASADPENRENAIHELKMANECDELAELASNDEIDGRYRTQALRFLGTPQCDSTLRRLVEEESLGSSLQETAEELLREMDD